MANKGYQVNVAQMERSKEMKRARAFRNSIRGQFILSQALTIAIKHLKGLEDRKDMFPKYGEHAQPSNRADMEYIKRELYPIYDVVPKSHAALQKFHEGEPTTADEYNYEHDQLNEIKEMDKAIKETPEYKLGKKVFGGDTGTDADYYDENDERYLND
jgi:hypothetical protein